MKRHNNIEQLEIPLWEALRDAASDPYEANVPLLLDALDSALPALGENTVLKLNLAAEAIAQIVQIFQERSTLAFEELEASTSTDGPVMPEDAFDRYVRQYMELDFEQFIEPLPALPRAVPERRGGEEEGESVVGEIDQQALLDALDEQMNAHPELTEAEAFNQAMEIAHAEDVGSWVGSIQEWFQQQGRKKVPLLELQQAIKMPLVQLWLALLLGGYQLEQRGGFYEVGTIRVDAP